jgi:transposase
MVWQKEALGLKTPEIAARLGVDPTTVRRIIRRTGHITKKKYPARSHPLRKLSSPVQFNIASLILQ